MKKAILSALLFTLALCSLQAQEALVFDPHPINVSDYINVNDNDYELVGYATVTNNSDEAISLRWERIIVDMPDGWEVQVCDLNLCYSTSVYSNFVPGEIEIPVVLNPGESTNMDVHVKPRGIAGTASIDIELSDTNDPDNIISTGAYTFEALVVTSTTDLYRQPFSIYPNPTADYISLRGQGVDRIVIYNILGRQMRAFNHDSGQRHFIGDLPNGLYLASLINDEQGTLKTVRLKKIAMRP